MNYILLFSLLISYSTGNMITILPSNPRSVFQAEIKCDDQTYIDLDFVSSNGEVIFYFTTQDQCDLMEQHRDATYILNVDKSISYKGTLNHKFPLELYCGIFKTTNLVESTTISYNINTTCRKSNKYIWESVIIISFGSLLFIVLTIYKYCFSKSRNHIQLIDQTEINI
jgi:hypothetical protein